MKVEKDESIDVQKALEFAKSTKSEPKEDKPNSLENHKHGDVIVDKNGIPGIVIDKEKKLRDIADNDPELQMVRDLISEDDPTFSRLDKDEIKLSEEEIEKILNKPGNEEQAAKVKEVRKKFANYHIAGNGILAPADDPRVKRYEEAMEKLRTGEVVLPTVSQYEEQQKAIKEKMEKGEIIVEPKQKTVDPPKQEEEVPETTDSETSLEEEKFIQEEYEMSEQTKDLVASAGSDPALEAISQKKEVEKKEETTPTTPASAEKQPIDLAALEAASTIATESVDNDVNEDAPVEEKKEEPPVTIEVPAEKADTFMNSMGPRLANKVDAAKVIKVNFTKDVNLPKATKRLTNIDGYRKVAPKNTSVELVPRILVNSGYIGYFRACGALEWNTLSPVIDADGNIGDMDIAKIAQFLYRHLSYTSMGKMSYREFLENTSSDDIEAGLHAILGASLPDEQDVVLACGRRSCGKEFPAKYRISELPDYDELDDETKKQILDIESAKNIEDDARDVHDNSPVMKKLVYTAEGTGTIFVFKHKDLAVIIDRTNVLDALSERYGESAAALTAFIPEVYIKVAETGNEEEDYALSTDPTIICEELYRLSSESLDEVRAVVEQIPMIQPVEYSMKGEYICPHCGNETKNPKQDILGLVFQVALKARYFV